MTDDLIDHPEASLIENGNETTESETPWIERSALDKFPIFAVSYREREDILAMQPPLFSPNTCRLLNPDTWGINPTEWPWDGSSNDLAFGSKPSRSCFALALKGNFLNHGAFGGPLKVSLNMAAAVREYQASDPPEFVDRFIFPYLIHVAREMAPLLGPTVRARDVYLCRNATAGLNLIIGTLDLPPNSVVLSLDVGYRSVKKMISARLARRPDLVHVEHELPPKPRSAQEILESFASGLPPRIDLVVIETVTSNTAMELPLHQLIPLLRLRGARILVDAAHSLGSNSAIDVESLDADFYVTNAHKWFSNAPGAAILWMNPGRVLEVERRGLEPPLVSHGTGEGAFSALVWDGYGDYGGLAALPSAVAFWRKVGLPHAVEYMRRLCHQAADRLVALWNTDTYVPAELYGTMALVRLPDGVLLRASFGKRGPNAEEGNTALYKDSCEVQNWLWSAKFITVPVKTLLGQLYVRISAHIYNRLDEYERLGYSVLEYAGE